MVKSFVCSLGAIVFSFKKRRSYLNNRLRAGKIRKVLILRSGAFGDILMTTPLVRLLHDNNYIVDYCVGDSFAVGLKGNTNVRKVIPFNYEKCYVKRNLIELIKLVFKIKKNNYDLIFVLDKHWGFGIIGAMSCKFRIGFDRYGEGFANNLNVKYEQKKHDIKYYLDFARFLGLKYEEKDYQMDLKIPRQDIDMALMFCKGKNIVGICPGGGKNAGQSLDLKIWGKENYVHLVKEIVKEKKFIKGKTKNNDNYVVLLGGPTDVSTCDYIIKNLTDKEKQKVHSFVGKLSIPQTTSIMKYCKAVVCNDSGPMHMAASVNNKVISIFGPTNPIVLAPLHKESKFIWKETKSCFDIYGDSSRCKKGIINKVKVEDVMKLI